ncbi:hypothetical protein BCR34DRAFT_676276 [Clohesyomyces aquaticus]|uniref:AB hydrolase-1 domain-containing protein n=1 Tax=Clohesyomyces aquaticus TaxID=1231657 RepID=A0A1Y1YVU4_9PLEO|nr:hypothetical protein BCR34DRAFT_676276 [Clohesyomyces aquaticus]
MATTYTKLISALRTATGCEVHVPRLLSVNGARPPSADLHTHTALVRSYVESLVEAGRKVIVLMHSYGGTRPTGLASGVSHLMYMTASALSPGQYMMSKVRESGHEELVPLAFDFADDNTVLSRDPRTLLIGETPGIAEKEVEEYLGTLVRWNGRCKYQELENCAWKEIPVTYILTTLDMTLRLGYQTSMVEEMRKQGREVKSVQIETGHCPNLTATGEVVDVVKDAIAGKIPDKREGSMRI